MLARVEFRFYAGEETLMVVSPSFCLHRQNWTATLAPNEVPSSSGLGHLVLIQEIAGSTPAGITIGTLQNEKSVCV